MRAVIQKVKRAAVSIDKNAVAQIKDGLLVLVGVQQGDDIGDIRYIVDKTVALRIFEDENDKLNLSVADLGYSLLVVSQFTLMGDARKGRRPSYIAAGAPQDAKRVFEQVVEEFIATGIHTQTGQFQADMDVELINAGPVTILLDSKKIF